MRHGGEPAAIPGAAPRLGVVELMGVAIDDVDERELIERIIDARTNGRGGWIVTPNVDVLRQVKQQPELSMLIRQADLVIADGMPLVWASRVQGTPLRERVTGAQLIWTLSAAAAAAGESVFLLGGAPGVADLAATNLGAAFPQLRIAGTHCPPFGFEADPDAHDAIRSALADADPGIVYCGLGFPKQEHLINRVLPEFPHTWFIGCGASLTFAAGAVRRAPQWMQDSGLEWVHRLGSEPGRLFSRYLVHDLPFALVMLTTSARRRVRPGAR